MKKIILLILMVSFSISCASQDINLVKEEMLTPPSLPPKIVYVEKFISEPNSIKITNLNWDTSDNWKRIKGSVDYKFLFDLGVSFQIGISDGFSGRKTTRDERAAMYPILKEYADKDKIKFIDLNVAYEGGFDMAVKYVQSNKAILSVPEPKEKTEKPIDKGIKGKVEVN